MTSCILCGENVKIRPGGSNLAPLHKKGGCPKTILKQYFSKNEYCYSTKCKYCSAEVFFVHHNGGLASFDTWGFPWPKHSCYGDDNRNCKLINAIINQEMEHASSYSFGTVVEAKQFQGRTWQILVECQGGDIALVKLQKFAGISKFKGELIGISELYKLIYFINPFEEREIFATNLQKHVLKILEMEWMRRPYSLGPGIGIQPISVEPANRETYVTNRLYRDNKISMQVKDIYHSRCQICSHYVELQDGRRYAECHHIKPIGEPHNGPDVIENLICVCPNCHVLLDYGVIAIDKAKLNIAVDHIVANEYVAYHNSTIFHKNQNN